MSTLLSMNGCVNCVNQSIHGNGKAVVIKESSKAVITPKVTPKKVTTTTPVENNWVLVSTTKEIVSSTPILF